MPSIETEVEEQREAFQIEEGECAIVLSADKKGLRLILSDEMDELLNSVESLYPNNQSVKLPEGVAFLVAVYSSVVATRSFARDMVNVFEAENGPHSTDPQPPILSIVRRVLQ